MSEQDAKKKRCCGPEGCGKVHKSSGPHRWCIGSLCMAWVWQKDATMTTSNGFTGVAYVDDSSTNGECAYVIALVGSRL